MKTFISALLILSVVVIGAFSNSILTENITNELISKTQYLTFDAPKEEQDEFFALWSKRRIYFDTTIPQSRIEYISQGIDLMQAAISANDIGLYEYGREMVCEGLNRIADISSLKLKNIL